VGGEDAVKLEPEMAPIFGVKDMVNLGVQNFYIKETIDGEAYDPFSAETLKVMPPTHRSFKKEIIEMSRSKYAVPAEAAQKLMQAEESKIMRSSHEKSIIEGKGKLARQDAEASGGGQLQDVPKPQDRPEEPLI
jgi:hypothetical protein